jgi:membrane protein required for colicin V production
MVWTTDATIVIVLVLTVLTGLSQGFIRSVSSFGGLVAGLILGEWNYARLGLILVKFLHFDAIANTVAFILIAVVAMQVFSWLGGVLSRTVHKIGLGLLDRLAGAIFGFFKGALLVTLCILVTLAFFPRSEWLVKARLPRLFFGTCHLSMRTSPAELKARVLRSLKVLEEESPKWLHPGSGKA